MKRQILVGLALLLLGSTLMSLREKSWVDNTFTKALKSRLTQFNQTVPDEKIYLQFDRPFYEPGDDIWFKAYLTDQHNHFSSQSEILHVELLDPKGNTFKKLEVVAKEGTAKGDFKLDAEAPGGMYKLRAYTRWQDNLPEGAVFEKDIQVQASVLPRLLMKLDFEREAYGAGDEVVAKLKLATLENTALSDHNFRFVAQLNGQALTNGRAETDAEGLALVRFKLPKELETNDGLLNVMIDHNGFTESISRSVPIVLNNIDLSFFPEGGDLVTSVKSRVAFEALNEFGKPADIQGVILNDQKQEVASFSSFHQGMGAFDFTPEAGQNYTARITKPAGIDKMYPLPAMLEKGYGMRIDRISEDELEVIVHAPLDKPMSLVALNGGSIRFSAALPAEAGETRVRISTARFPMGITRFTLFDYREVERCERLVFVNHNRRLNVELATNKQKYQPREQVEMTVKVSDSDGLPVAANLSLAVTDDKLISFADDKQDNILSRLLLTAELKGEVEEPNFYFDPTEAKAEEALDYLLMTRGWRRFAWKDLQEDGGIWAQKPAVNPEQMVISGRVWPVDANQPMKGIKVQVLETEEETYTDAEGNFYFEGIDLTEPKTLQATHRDGRTRLLQINDYTVQHVIRRTIRGVVVDENSGEPLIGANVVVAGTTHGVSTNVDGQFVLRDLPDNAKMLNVNYVGFDFQQIPIQQDPVTIRMKSSPMMLQEVVVMEERQAIQKVARMANAVAINRAPRKQKDRNRGRKAEAREEVARAAKPVPPMDDELDKALEIEMEEEPMIAFNEEAKLDLDVDDLAFKWDANGQMADSIGQGRWGFGNQFWMVENMPEPPGGQKAFERAMTDNLQVPRAAVEAGIEGTVIVQFVVDEAGQVEQPVVLRGIGHGCDEAAVAVIEELGEWTPGQNGGKPVNTRMVVPVRFGKDHLPASGLMFEVAQREKRSMRSKAPKYYRAREFYAPQYHQKAAVQERTDFRKTVFWESDVVVGPTGKTTVTFFNTDEVSAFRATIEGIDGSGLIGRAEHTFYTQLPFALDVRMPTVLSYGDETAIPIVLTNNTENDLVGALGMTVPQNFEVLNRPDRNQRIKAGQTVTRYLKAKVKFEPGDGAVAVRFDAAALGDQVEAQIKVLPKGFPNRESYSSNEANQSYPVNIQDVVPNSIQASVTAYPDVLSDLMEGVESILREPYGCFEQTSASAYPNVMALRYMEQSGDMTASVRTRALDLTKKGYKRLTSFETKSKGYEWFGKAPGHEGLTAYGLMEFNDMKGVIPGVDQRMIDRTAKWIANKKDGKGGFERNSRALDQFGRASDVVNNAYIVYALSEAGYSDLELEFNTAFEEAMKSEDMYRVGCVAVAADNLGKKRKADQALKLIQNTVKTKKFGSLKADHSITRSGGRSLQVETAGLLTLAMLRANQVPFETVQQGVEYLVGARSGGSFGSTQATIMALKALTGYASYARQTQDSGTIEFLVDGKVVASQPYEGGRKEPIRVEGLGAFLEAGQQDVSVRFAGAERGLPYTLDVEWSTFTPKDNPECEVTLDLRWTESEVKIGETARLQTVITNPKATGLPSTMVRIGIPSGFSAQPWQLKELQEKELVDFYEVRGNYVHIYYREMAPSEVHTINLDLKAEIPGTYNAPASSAYLYYTNEYKDWEGGQEVVISY